MSTLATSEQTAPTARRGFPGLRRRFILSTRVQILGWYLTLLAVAIFFGLLIQRGVLLNQLDGDVDQQLRQEVQELNQLSEGRNPATGRPFGNDIGAIFGTFLSRNIPSEGEVLFTLVNGRPFAATVAPVQLLDDPAFVAELVALEDTTRSEIDTSAGRVRYMAVPVRAEDGMRGVFVVAIFLEGRRDGVDRVIRDGALAFGSMFLVASVLAWFAAGRVLRPVSLLTTAARTITDEDWSERIAVQGNDEIAELTRTFNDMLDRLEAAFATQRRFIDDAGHELRTPITIIRGHLELLSTDPAERDDTIRIVTDELDRMARMVDELLVLAKSDQPDFLNLHPIDVAELTRDVAAKASALADRQWTVEHAAEVVMIADGQRLTQAMMNLARNAVEHTAVGTPIRLGSRAVDGDVRLWVTDTGEGIAAADRERIFDRFSRGHAGRRSTDGAGLGLAIVDVIAAAHGGRIELESAVGLGSTFMLVLPADGPPRDDA